ncbi:hypothetical protein V9K67_17470 [Paraflavisolibacter sp. H34]|uniref:hypothetical protein n=1 Tax=Huijunlia imazamoxiresistens TaxID=3127457 RepID=UPI003017580E
MDNRSDYMERYFGGRLTEAERAAFEQRCQSDPGFADEVAFYVSARAALKEQLQEQKRQQHRQWYAELSAGQAAAPPREGQELPPAGRVRRLPTWLKAAAAACVLLALGWLLFLKPPSAQQLADRYIEEHLQVLGVHMGAGDSLQTGIAAYNQKNYPEAERVFTALQGHGLYAAEAVKNLGLVYLVTGRYDAAVRQFDVLTGFTDLRVNEGYFYKAVALIKRDREGDRLQAKALLEKVKRQGQFGSEQAEQWLQDL